MVEVFRAQLYDPEEYEGDKYKDRGLYSTRDRAYEALKKEFDEFAKDENTKIIPVDYFDIDGVIEAYTYEDDTIDEEIKIHWIIKKETIK